jgi:large subunit ribosomal protein L31e
MIIERTYNIPLREGFIKTARYKKTKKAVTTLKEFLSKHMKSDKILIGKHLNEALWVHGIKNPPHHIKVAVRKEEDGTVKAELLGVKYEHKKKEEKEKESEKPEKNLKKDSETDSIQEKKTLKD